MRQGSWERKIYEDFSDVYNPTQKALRVSMDRSSPFGEFSTVSRTPIIELNSSYGFSALRDVAVVSNGGTIGQNGAEFVISSNTTPNGIARLESAEVGRYVPGYSAEIGLGIRIPTPPTGNQYARWGGLGSEARNGVYFGIDAQGYYVARLKSDVETRVYQADWNIDKLDGTGVSTFNINNADGHIFQVTFSWYGYGAIEFSVVGTVGNVQRVITCHAFSDFNDTSVDSPNLKVFTEVSNGGDTTNFQTFCGGRQFSILGEYNPKFRFSGDFRQEVNTNTTVIPLISFRRKALFGDRSIKLQGYNVLTTGVSHVVEVRLNGTLTGASFGTPTNHTPTETAMQSDRAATAISGGIVVWQELIGAGARPNDVSLSGNAVDFDLPDEQIISLCVRTLTGTGTAASSFRIREEW